MNKRIISFSEYKGLVNEVCRQIANTNWRPDYVVGITRGGSLPAVMISQYFDIPCEMLKISLRDGSTGESNLWMAEDAYGFNAENVGDPCCKNILVVDDINDQGTTIAWIKNDWEQLAHPGHDVWQKTWGHNVRFATLTNNLASKETVDYSVWEVNKAEEDCWLVYPWEDFWL